MRLARPSATASAKFGEQTVNQSQDREVRDEAAILGEVKMPAVVEMAPTIVTNMTGFLIVKRGSSFLKASPTAEPTMFQSNKEGAL